MHGAEIIVNDLFRHLFVCLWMWTFLPAIFVGGSHLLGADGWAHTALEIRAFRLQHYEHGGGQQYGSKSWHVAYEAVTFNGSALRKCLVIHWREISTADGTVTGLNAVFGAAVGAVLVVLPNPAVDGLAAAEKELLLRLEEKLAAVRTEQAVYFAHESPELTQLLSNIRRFSARASIQEQLRDALMGDQYLITASNQHSTATSATTKTFNVVGQLNAAEKGRPYVVIAAHYDSTCTVPALAQAADSNGSGVALLLELLAVLSGLYNSRGASVGRPKYNVVFLFSTAGKWGYQGTRQWIDDFNEKQPTDKVALAISLDALAHASGKETSFYAHVSKTPSNGSTPHSLLQHLNSFSPRGKSVQVVAKKINLAAERLAWEHEILNVRKVHALTLSHFSNHTDPMRSSILDVRDSVDMEALKINANVVVNAVLSLLYGLDSALCEPLDDSTADKCSILNAANGVQGDRLGAWMDMFATRARPIASPDATRPVVEDLKELVKKYADRWELQEVALNDFVLYGTIEDVLTAQVVKPALFELLLSILIALYLLAMHQLALNAQSLIDTFLAVRPLVKVGKKVH